MNKSMNTLAVGLVGCMLSIAYLLLIPLEIPFMESPFGVTSRTVPYWGGGLGLVFGLVLSAQAFFRRTAHFGVEEPTESRDENPTGGSRRMGFALLTFVGYLLALPALGYAIATFLAVLVLLLIFSRDRLLQKALISAGLVATLYVVFSVLLNVELPQATIWGAS
jgi:hypothetical protein